MTVKTESKYKNKFSFTIPGELPNLNEIIAASKYHYGAYAGLKKRYTQLVMNSVKDFPVTSKADFKIIWHCKNKRKDKDNIMAGQKFIFDGLVEAGILENDGWKQIGNIKHLFVVNKNNPKVEVIVYERLN